MKEIAGCEVCGADSLERVLDLGDHPMCDDLVPIGHAARPRQYPISIGYCAVCRTAHQLYQIPKQTLFPQAYHYRARHTQDVLNGMRQLVDRCEAEIGALSGLKVVDVGCNDGSLLSIFASRGCRTIGIEPTGAAADAVAAGHSVYHDYLTEALAGQVVAEHGKPDIVTFTNVFAHIEDLGSVLRAVSALMGPQTLLVIENHYLGAVLDRYQFDTFYHEHPRTYSLTSFRHIAAALGGRIVAAEFPARYGGNIRVMIRLGGEGLDFDNPAVARSLPREDEFGERLVRMGAMIPTWREWKRDDLDRLVARHGPLSGKAFPGRAAILVKLLGLDAPGLEAVYEKPGSMKVGHYLPGTSVPIRSDDDFDPTASAGRPLLNLAWHISAEIHAYMRGRGFDGPIVDIFGVEEFERLA